MACMGRTPHRASYSCGGCKDFFAGAQPWGGINRYRNNGQHEQPRWRRTGFRLPCAAANRSAPMLLLWLLPGCGFRLPGGDGLRLSGVAGLVAMLLLCESRRVAEIRTAFAVRLAARLRSSSRMEIIASTDTIIGLASRRVGPLLRSRLPL